MRRGRGARRLRQAARSALPPRLVDEECARAIAVAAGDAHRAGAPVSALLAQAARLVPKATPTGRTPRRGARATRRAGSRPRRRRGGTTSGRARAWRRGQIDLCTRGHAGRRRRRARVVAELSAAGIQLRPSYERVTVRPFGEQAVLLELTDNAAAVRVARRLRAECRRLIDVVPGHHGTRQRGRGGPDRRLLALAEARPPRGRSRRGSDARIPVRYDGPDSTRWPANRRLAEELADVTCVRVRRRLPRVRSRVRVPARRRRAVACRRRTEPRVRVRAGAVALGGVYCGVYPRESPGGWQLIGSTETVFSIPGGRRPLLSPGDRVRFPRMNESSSGGWAVTTVQDRGRRVGRTSGCRRRAQWMRSRSSSATGSSATTRRSSARGDDAGPRLRFRARRGSAHRCRGASRGRRPPNRAEPTDPRCRRRGARGRRLFKWRAPVRERPRRHSR